MGEIWLTQEQVCRKLSIERTKLWKLTIAGVLKPSHKLGAKNPRFAESEIDAFMTGIPVNTGCSQAPDASTSSSSSKGSG